MKGMLSVGMRGQRPEHDWRALVSKAREHIRAELGDRQPPPSEEILRQTREERDAQLLALR